MKIVFVSNTKHRKRPYLDAATRYRCFNPAEDLSRLGHLADVCSLSDFSSSLETHYDVFVFHKPSYSRSLERAINRLRSNGKQVIADYDDLIFNPNHALDAPAFLLGSASERIIKGLHEKNLAALELFENVTVSTKPLSEEVRKMNPGANVEVVHNGLSRRWLDAASVFEGAETGIRTIGYFPGTRSHDHDFQLILQKFVEYLSDHGDTRLLVAESLEMQEKGFDACQVSRHTHVDYMDLPQLILQCWVTIAPLQSNRFNQCKSGLKFFESAAFGVPVIATSIPDMRRFEGSGIFLAETPEDYLAALEALRDPEIYYETSRSVRDYALEHCMSMSQTKKFLDFIEQANCLALQDVSCGY